MSETVQTQHSSGYTPLILIVEDNELNRDTLRDILEFENYRVSIAQNGQEAIWKTNEEMPNLILMDIQMPIMNGLEATQSIRENPRTAEIPIIVLTGLAMQWDRERCLAMGANAYLTKPISYQTLIEKISSFL
ncbi:MAG: response regulator [Ardenticatenaceae bacterium]|nr:response regulator [Ardenticatenaceae bacterium]